MKNKKPKVRLSTGIIPIKYDIQLHPDLENFTFEGTETITVSIQKPTTKVILHSKEIEITTAEFKSGKDKNFAKISYQDKAETVTLAFAKSLPKGKNKITLTFKGILNDKMRGFYRSSYIYDGKIHNMATTQFEATDARRAFPCFDEPAHKSVFQVSLVVPKGKTAISNTLPISTTEHESGFEVVKFHPTPKMSTYLLAFLVGDFEYVEKKSKRGVLVRVYTTPGKKHQAGFALDTTVKVLEFYEKYFDIPYPLDTLDMIAIPDFSAGAMENWGAVTYRESMLLVDPENSATSNKQWVALVIAHELAHQWFGNLVTMEWWTHLWLNEGFASYIEYLAVDKLFPAWDIWTQFCVHDLGAALKLDSLHHTHAIEIPVHHPEEIGEIFDAVSYSKGASVIRMLANHLGEENFRDGLRYYLKKHSYKNTETVHLWQAFEKVSKKPVAKIMHNWTSKPGYPVISVTEGKNKEELTFTQERFFMSPASKVKSKDKTIWQIPVSVNQDSFLMNKKKVPAVLCSGIDKYVKVNMGETSFHRTAYSHDLLMRLKHPVSTHKLPASDRLGIIRDLFALAESGVVPTTYVLEFLPAYQNEDDYTVWLEISTGLGKLKNLLAKTKTAPKLDAFTIKLFSPIANKLGWEKKKGEKHTDVLLRSLAIAKLGGAGDKKVLAKIKFLWKSIQSGEQIDPDLRMTVYRLTAENGGMKEYKKLISRYTKETLHEEKNRIGYALGDFKDVKILEQVAEFAMSSDVRIQDTIGILTFVGFNPLGRDVFMNFIKKNWQEFLNRYGSGGYALGRLVNVLAGSSEKKHLKFYETFFKDRPAPGATRSIEQTKERIEANIMWLSRDHKSVDKFLR